MPRVKGKPAPGKNAPRAELRPLTERQASRLGTLADLDAKDLAGKTVAQIEERFRFHLDLTLLLFRRVCGRVVKKDPITGVERGVPFATVHVEDTDCNFLGYFPGGWPWGWFFPFHCRREEIASVQTDECGRFCVLIPRWDIDWILRWRRERICFPDILIKPSVRDILEGLKPVPRPPIPIPEPDPPPFLLKDAGMSLRRAEELVDREIVRRLAALETTRVVGGSRTPETAILDRPAFAEPVPPPLPRTDPRAPERSFELGGPDTVEALAKHLRLDPGMLKELRLDRFIGPFIRCRDIFVPEWVPVFDVPDITFRVTQDVDGDGDEETIYTEGFFDVRWNAGSIPDVTLYASQNAVASVTCDVPDDAEPCGDPEIRFAGLMSVKAPYHDAVSGYALRPNKPRPGGLWSSPQTSPAQAPYAHEVQLYGCNQLGGAQYYRLRYSFDGASPVPFVNLTWPIFPSGGGPSVMVTPDGNGWYPILTPPEDWFPFRLLLNWPTQQFQAGVYGVDLQLGSGAKAVVHTSPVVNFRVDNRAPAPVMFTSLAWRVAGSVGWTDLELICPVVVRPLLGGSPAGIEFRVGYQASAGHLRSLRLTAAGCGAGGFTVVSAPSTVEHWHTSAADNSHAATAIFSLAGGMPPGAYSFHLSVQSRAFNPAGGDPGALPSDWHYDTVVIETYRMLPVAIVNA